MVSNFLLVFIQQTSSASCCCCNSGFSLHLFPLLISFELRVLHGEKSFTTIIIIFIAVSEAVAICRSLDREAQVSRQQQHHQKCCSCFAQNVLRSTARKSNWCSVSSLRSQEVNVFTISLTNHFGLMIISGCLLMNSCRASNNQFDHWRDTCLCSLVSLSIHCGGRKPDTRHAMTRAGECEELHSQS